MTYHIFVSGRVQGVGYRRFAQKSAQTKALPGWARNVWDGRVEIMISGPEQQLDEYCEMLKRGPVFSKVQEVLVKIVVNEGLEQQEFEILPDLEHQ